MYNEKNLYEAWQRSFDSALEPVTKWAEFTGAALDAVAKSPLTALTTCLHTTARQRELVLTGLGLLSEEPVGTRVALVTGGLGGIGTALCQRLARDGNEVVATHIPGESETAVAWQREQRAEGFMVHVVECDVTQFDSCAAMVQRVNEDVGPIDILVNCAGIVRDATLRKMEEQQWQAVLQTNLDSLFNVTRQVVDGMIKRGFGRIINISSVNGQKGQFGQTNYSAAKAGMLGFARSLARELADKGITVNSVCPGYVATDMVKSVPEHIFKTIVDQVPLGRLAEPSEIASAVAFLASEESAYITGAELAVNGGLYMG